MSAAAELRLHPDDEVEELFALDDLGDRLPAYGRRDYGLYVGYVDSVARDLVPIDIDEQTWLAQFPNDREFRKARHFGKNILNLNCLVLKHVQVFAVDFDG